MPARQYFYTPILIEDHNIGEQDVNGDYTESSACSPGATNPAAPLGGIKPVYDDDIMCLRVDTSNGRCVVSVLQETNQVYIEGSLVDLGTIVGEWQQVSKAQIQSEYQNGNTLADDAQIDFTVEEE